MTRRRFDLFAASEKLMRMDEAAWARHANPWSVYSRMTVLPLMTLAVWSRVWLGWGALLPVALVLVWTWWNPRAFGPPASTVNWASRGTFGERVFLNRRHVPIPAHHARWAKGLAWVSGLGALPWLLGIWQLDPGFTLFGLAVMVGGKLWFVDRMVWLYQDMNDRHPAYAAWTR
ncbi:hypothetical protein RA19_15515 [Leisingera sp. ANG-M1]|uniref:DUF6653 family protein n=1 Tax=Leisingera sp. ANG-M1 TaxID=1577895 RepID=UPI000580A59B|nr:DUF6653 family protein [Leisingera sp. ANG-M1]KIC09420.1 hypothetical protein RA19_15515 [Leisingera sp. ANG-M1]